MLVWSLELQEVLLGAYSVLKDNKSSNAFYQFDRMLVRIECESVYKVYVNNQPILSIHANLLKKLYEDLELAEHARESKAN